MTAGYTAAAGPAGTVLASFSLPVTVNSYHGLSWSRDNQLAVSSRRGVHVFTVTPNYRKQDNSLNFVKTFVENESQLMDWQLENMLGEEEIMTLSQEQKNEVFLDRNLSPHMSSGETSFKQPYKVGLLYLSA